MKKKMILSLACLFVFALSSPPTVKADWLSALFGCTGAYMYGADGAWNTYNYNSNQTPSDYTTLMHSLDDALSNYQGCNWGTTAPTIDFCTSALIALDNCNSQFEGLTIEYWQGYNACRVATGADGYCF